MIFLIYVHNEVNMKFHFPYSQMSCHEKVSSGQYHLVMAYLRNPKTWISEEKKSVTRGDFCLLLPTMSLSWRGHLWFF